MDYARFNELVRLLGWDWKQQSGFCSFIADGDRKATRPTHLSGEQLRDAIEEMEARLRERQNGNGYEPPRPDPTPTLPKREGEKGGERYDAETNKMRTYSKVDMSEAAQKMRRKMIAMARARGWETERDGKKVADMEKLNGWCIRMGRYKKGLNFHTLEELPHLISQFEKVPPLGDGVSDG